MDMLRHKKGVNGAMLGTQSKFNEFVKFDGSEVGKRVPGKQHNLFKNLIKIGYCGYVPCVRAENLHGRTFGASSSIVSVNKRISKGDLCPNRPEGVSDLQAYLNIRNEKEKIRASHLNPDTGMHSRLLDHRMADDGRQISINFDNIYGEQ
jgi:hypothetical protein